MNELNEKNTTAFAIEDIAIGERSSRLSGGIFFILCLLPVLGTIVFGAVDNTTWVVVSIVWLTIVLLWIADSWKAGGILLNTSSLSLPVLGLLAIGLVQIVAQVSLDPYATRFFVTRLAVYIVFFAACLTFINNEKRLNRIVLLTIIFGALMAFFGILQRLANPEAIYGLRVTPQAITFGPFVNQHHFAAFMQMTAGLAIGLIFGRETKLDKKIALGIAVLVMAVAAVFTGSRGGLLGFVAVPSLVVLVVFLNRKSDEGAASPVTGRLIVVGALFLIAIVGAALFLGGSESLLRGTGLANADADISSGRTHFWAVAIKIFLAHPFLGAGLDAFGVAFTQYDTSAGLFRVEQAHNEYLQMLADAGVPGLLCVAAFIVLLFKKGLAVISNSEGFRRSVAIGALAGCTGILVHSFFDFPLRTPSNAFFFLILSAVATVPVAVARRSKRRRRSAT